MEFIHANCIYNYQQEAEIENEENSTFALFRRYIKYKTNFINILLKSDYKSPKPIDKQVLPVLTEIQQSMQR